MAKVVVEMTSDEAKLYRGMARLVGQQKKMEDGFRKAGKKSEEAFGSKAVSQLAAFAGGLVSIGAAASLARNAIQSMQEVRDRAGKMDREAEFPLSKLKQLAGSQAEFQTLTGLARQTFREGGAKSMGGAASTIFSLASANALGERALFSSLFSGGVVEDPALMAGAVRQMLVSVGEAETGGIRPLVSKAFAASSFTQASAEALLSGAARGGGGARALGMSDEELLAATAVVGDVRGIETGSTQVSSLLKALDLRGRLGGKELLPVLQEIKSQGMSAKELTTYFGTFEALGAFRTLTDAEGQASYRTALEEIRAANEVDMAAQKLKFSIPATEASRIARMAEAERDVGVGGLGVMNNLASAAEASMVAEMRRSGANEAAIAFRKIGFGLQRTYSGDRAFLEAAFEGTAGQGLGLMPGMMLTPGSPLGAEARGQITEVMNQQALEDMRREEFRGFVEATRNLNRASDRVGGGTTLDKPDHDPGFPPLNPIGGLGGF